MNTSQTSKLRRHAVALLAAATLAVSAGQAHAGGFTACDAPFVFSGAAANVVPLEFLATAADSKFSDDRRAERLQFTAQHLAWLIKLDSWHQPTYGSLGVVAHMFVRRKCEPDTVLRNLLRGGASEPVRAGQVLVMLQGRIFVEGERIYLQSRLRALRRNADRYDDKARIGDHVAPEALSVRLGDSGRRLSAGLPPLDVTFAPRAIDAGELAAIDERFAEASKVFPSRSMAGNGKPLRFEKGEPYAFTVQIGDEGWIRIEEMFGHAKGFIRVNPDVSRHLHQALPELDFLNGLLGFLRLSQARQGDDFAPPPRAAAGQAAGSLLRFVEHSRTGDDAEARALALALVGVLHASADLRDFAKPASAEGWSAARQSFAEAVRLAPHRGVYRNLLGVADAMLCCAGATVKVVDDPARAFADSLSLSPNDREALSNLDAFLARLSEMPQPPEGINVARLAERRAVVRKVVDSYR